MGDRAVILAALLVLKRTVGDDAARKAALLSLCRGMGGEKREPTKSLFKFEYKAFRPTNGARQD